MDTASLLQRFGQLPFSVEAEVGNLTLTIGEILTLEEGAVLKTDHPAGAPFLLRAGGAELAETDVFVVGDSLAVRVISLWDKDKSSVGGNGTD